MIEFLLFCVVALFFVLFVMSGIYDIRNEKQQKRIAELEKENAELHFDNHRESANREQFEGECG